MNLAIVELKYPRKRQKYDAPDSRCIEAGCEEFARFMCINGEQYVPRCDVHGEAWAERLGLRIRLRGERAA